MGQRELSDARFACDTHRVLDRAVAPVDFVRIFSRRVLRIVNEQIRAGRELGVSQVGSIEPYVTVGGGMRIDLVIARVDDGRAVALEPVGERQRGMVEMVRRDADVVDLETALQ